MLWDKAELALLTLNSTEHFLRLSTNKGINTGQFIKGHIHENCFYYRIIHFEW